MIPHRRTPGVARGGVPARPSVGHRIFKRDIGFLLGVHMKCGDRERRLALITVNPWSRRATGALRNVGGDAAILAHVSVRGVDTRIAQYPPKHV
jgi:hypothetical protein